MAESAHVMSLKRGATEIADVTRITGPGLALETADISALDSDWRERLATILDGGEVTFDLAYDPDDADHVQIVSDLTAKTKTTWHVYLDAGGGAEDWSFEAYVTGFEPTGSAGEALTASATLSVDGAVTIT
ncbi:MAG: phage tail tube protein [Phycisphaerae bacterium]